MSPLMDDCSRCGGGRCVPIIDCTHGGCHGTSALCPGAAGDVLGYVTGLLVYQWH